MLLAIKEEKEAIASEIKAMEKVGLKVSNKMSQFRQFKQFKVIIGLIQKHLKQLQAIQNYDSQTLRNFRVEPYMDASHRIKNHLVKKAQEVKQLINDATFGSYATTARTCLSKISYRLGQIEVKMLEALRFIEEAQRAKIDEKMTE